MAERSHWWTDRWLRYLLFLSFSVSFSDCLPTYPPIYLCIHLSLCLSIYLSIFLSFYLFIYLSICLSVYLSIYLTIMCLLIYLSIYLPIFLSIYRSKKLFISLSISVCLSIYLSICKLENEALLRDFLILWSWQHQELKRVIRLLHFLNLTASKTKHCETSFKMASKFPAGLKFHFYRGPNRVFSKAPQAFSPR